MKSITIVFLLLVMCVFLVVPASAWISGYDYRMPIEINNTGNNLTNHQYSFTINTTPLVLDGKLNVNGSDCRITNSTDVLQEFWNETAFNTSSTKIWVNGTFLGNVSNTTHYMYYGKSDAVDITDGSATFEYFDDYNFDLITWNQYANNPIVNETTAYGNRFDDGYIYDPIVIKNGTNDYIMYYTGGRDAVGLCRDRVGIQTSSDLINWTPYNGSQTLDSVVTCGSPGDFDYDRSWFDGTVIRENATSWKMWYIGDSDSAAQHIARVGYATSTDGYSWTKLNGGEYGKSIFEDMDGASSGGRGIAGCTVLKENDTDYKMWYVIYQNSNCKYATSTNGLNWTIQNNDNAVHSNWLKDVKKIDGTYYAWTSDGSNDYMYVYTSTDCTNWTKQNGIQLSATGSGWDSGRIYSPRLIEVDNTWYAYFAGYNVGVTTDCRIGLATLNSTIPITGTETTLLNYTDEAETTHSFTGTTMEISHIYTAQTYSGIKINNITNLNNFAVNATFVPLTDTSTKSMFGFKSKNGTPYQQPSFYFYENSGSPLMRIQDNDVTLNSSSPGWSNDQTYYMEMIYDNKDMTVTMSGYNSSVITATTTNVIPSDFYITTYTGSDGGTSIFSIDNFFYRKFASPEPITSLGAEELKITKPTIELISFTPTPLNTNYTGVTVISYMVESTNPLNLSSLAFLYGLNYTTTGDMHNYIATPPIDIASEGIYLAPNRNITPYLSWEFNDTITEGNIWQWGGGDNNSWWIEKNQINATHTYINATGVTQHILPSSFYIQKLAMYNAPKTGFEINRQQGLIFKMWNVEEIRNRGHNYFANLYFDTSWESTLPNYPVEVGFCNYSYNPAVDDIDTCPDCTKFGEWDGNRWVNHSWVPGPNASYAYPFIVNGSQYTEPTPTDITYIWLRSNTISSKSFVLNATNYDPGITNISFAETETMWTYNELNGVTSPVAYTPSFFTTFVRNDEELLHHLYIADDTGVWGHSDIFSESIGISSVPVPPVSFEYFNVTCDESYHDSEMDATYDQGTVGVGMHCPADPDGTSVSHNLTLHYYPNMTLVAVINNTFTTTGLEDVEIEFTTTPYYSPDTLYTLRCVSTDGDDNVATKWLISYFALDADGNRGWVKDSMLLFWGMDDIPTLYTEVNNNSLISYDDESDVYTMHVPFFKSKGNDTFNFNETVHLESLNNEDVAFFRFMGRTYFDNANIAGWNTTTDAAASITDEYRAYVYSLTMTCGNITNSNFSYLGSDFYRQEGLNFVGNSYPYLIHNSTFSNNAEGPIFEECVDFTISNCTIRDNVNVGIGVYFSDDFIIENNTISSNGGRGIVMYEANNNTISYNDITDSGIHGVHYWSNSQNNTCTGNDISGSALYDYYLSSSSLGNYIIDPISTTDRIRVTSTSSVNIENTDNAVFTEDSLNTSYAHLTNFSMYVTGASQTFDITQRDMTIIPSNDNLSIQNFDWGNTIQFNAESSIGVNQTWFNITNERWKSEQISIFIDGLSYNISYADDNGTLDYNYSVSIGDNFFGFVLTTPPSPVPVSLFIFMGVLLFVFCVASFILTGIPSIFTSILSIMFSFIMSKIAVNGSLVQNIGGISSTGAVVQGVTRIEIPALSYILIFVGIFMTVILAVQVLREIKFRESQDVIELD